MRASVLLADSRTLESIPSGSSESVWIPVRAPFLARNRANGFIQVIYMESPMLERRSDQKCD
jgi:hypothetical protein